jgi:hypothetical protein
MKSLKTNPNSAKEENCKQIVLHIIGNTCLDFIFLEKKQS